MNLVKFNTMNVLCRTVYNADKWLLSAEVGNTRINLGHNMGLHKFFETIESMDGLISNSDIGWVNELCRLVLDRDYRQPQVKAKPVSEDSYKARYSRPSIQEAKIMSELSAKNDRASVKR